MTPTCVTFAGAAVLVLGLASAGCYLSHERLDDTVPPSACVDDEATVALTPANRMPGACQEIEVPVELETICHLEPQPPGGRDTGYTYPEQWRRVRFVNTTDTLAVAKIELFGAACPTSGVACRAIGWVDPLCGCPEGVSLAAVGPVPEGSHQVGFLVEAHTEAQLVVTGTAPRIVLTICDR